MYRNGQQFRAGIGITTMHPTLDWETYSEAGYVWNPAKQKWESLPGLSSQNRGLKAVGAYNYITHPTFEPLSLSYNLLDGRGEILWIPRMTEFGLADEPHDLIAYIRDGGIVEAFNVGFEAQVWNLYCVPRWGWPPLPQEQERCCMAKARANALPGGLGDVCDVLDLVNKKDPTGDKLIRKLTVPKNPGGYYKPIEPVAPPARSTPWRPRQRTFEELTRIPDPPKMRVEPSGEYFDDDIPF
jgi:hypothetical protein